MQDLVFDNSTLLPPVFREGGNETVVVRGEWVELYQIWSEYRPFIGASEIHLCSDTLLHSK